MNADNDNLAHELGAEDLSLVSRLAREQRALAARIVVAEEALKKLKEDYIAIECGRLPDAMLDLGVVELKLADGSTLKRQIEYHPGIPKDRRAEAYEFLRKNGLGDVIKTELTITFSRGEEKLARQRYKAFVRRNPGRPITIEENVHSSTLKALVRERAEGEAPLPEDLFGVHVIARAVLKTPKA